MKKNNVFYTYIYIQNNRVNHIEFSNDFQYLKKMAISETIFFKDDFESRIQIFDSLCNCVWDSNNFLNEQNYLDGFNLDT